MAALSSLVCGFLVAFVHAQPLLHAGHDCWHKCGGNAGRCDWCGQEGACCQKGDLSDPAECTFVQDWYSNAFWSHHECVLPRHPEPLEHAGHDCWEACGEKGGQCNYCGSNGLCCKKDSASDPAECKSVTVWFGHFFGHHGHHQCVHEGPMLQLENAGQSCWEECNQKPGRCDFCGLEGACCKKGSEHEAEECSRVEDWDFWHEFLPWKHHECVLPKLPASVPTTMPTPAPTSKPTAKPTPAPTVAPTPSPTPAPTHMYLEHRWIWASRGQSCTEACDALKNPGWQCEDAKWPKGPHVFNAIAHEVGLRCKRIVAGGNTYDPSEAQGYCGWDQAPPHNTPICDVVPPLFTRRLCPCGKKTSPAEHVV